MLYQARFAHLEEASILRVGDNIRRGDIIGRMGSSGKSTANHLHFDLIQTVEADYVYRLDEIMDNASDVPKLLEQYYFFLDCELFNYPLHITSYFGDPEYTNHGSWEFHPAFDVVPLNRHETKANFDIHWNRTATGKVVRNDYDGAYGHHVCVAFQV